MLECVDMPGDARSELGLTRGCPPNKRKRQLPRDMRINEDGSSVRSVGAPLPWAMISRRDRLGS